MRKMNRLLLTIFLTLFSFTIQSQTANFTHTPTVGGAIPHTVFFTDQSTLPDTWFWDFGDFNMSTLQNPVHNYTTTGEFDVKLIVTDTITGGQDMITKKVRISIPTADFTGSGSNFFSGGGGNFFGCGPLTTNFVDNSTANGATITAWSWNFGDGVSSTDQNPTHTYNTSGIYNVSLTVTDAFGNTNTNTKNTFVQVIGPDVNFTSTTTTIGSNPLTVSFQDQTIFGAPIVNWAWDFGDGGASNLQNPSHTYNTTGAFDVSLTVTDIDGCSRTFTRTDFVNVIPGFPVVSTRGVSEGNHNSSSPHWITFFGNRSRKVQYIVTVAELNEAGLVDAGFITALDLNYTSANTTSVNGLKMNIGSTSMDAFSPEGNTATSLSNISFISTGLTSVISSGAITPTASVGWNTFTFDTSYMWDGTSNLVIEMCTDVFNSPGTPANISFETTGTNLRTNQSQSTSTSGCALTNGQAISQRPIMRFTAYDAISPTVTINSTAADPINGSFTTTFTFSEAVTDFVLGDITVGNGTASAFASTSTSVYTATITPTTNGAVTVDVAADVAQDAATNGNTAATQFSITADLTDPTVTITSTETSPTQANPIPITITFSEEVVGFADSDIIISNGTLNNFATTDNTIFTANLVPSGDGNITIDINAGVSQDIAGNDNEAATQFVIFYDTTAPVADVTVLPNATGECNVTVTPPTATDNFSGTITATTTDPLTYTTQGTFTVNWSYDDGNGNISMQTQTIIVDDVTPPVAGVTTLPNATGECSVTITSPTATDNCEGVITATTSDPLTYTTQGTFTVNWSYNDGNGNISTQTQTVIVDDVTAPVADVTTLPNATGECSVTVTSPTATDNCEGTITATTTDSLTYTTQGTFTINWSYDDGNGNISMQTQTVIVDDVTAPVADVTTLPDATGECSVTVTSPTATDNCEGSITATTTDPLTYTTQGIFTINWSYDDGNGNISTQTQTVTVDDVTAPVADVTTLPDATGECSVTVTSPTATDNCEGSITATTTDPLTYTTQGTFTINWSYDDGNGNISMQTQTVIVDDVTAPVADVTTLPNATGECSVTITVPTATDNCKGSITATTTDPLTYTTQGTFTVNWSYNDGNGNISTQTQTVIVDDVTAPVADVTTLPNATGECSVTVTSPTATDNCEGTITATTTDSLTYTTQGTFTVNWSYDDGNGNISIQTQTVIVDDVTAPVADVTTLPNATGECSVTITVPTATDNCEGSITATTTDPLTYTTQGTFTINWSYGDGNGNISMQTQTVIVDDVTAPVADVTTLPNVTGECSVTVTSPTATDNCEGSITATTTDPLTYTTQGTFTINWSYDDGNGNISMQTQTVIVDDVTAPVADVTTLPNVTGECSVTVTSPTATDNCEGSITGTTTDPLTYTTQGIFTVNWSYDDGNGNISTQAQTVIVDDVTLPTATSVVSLTIQLDTNGLASITASDIDNGSNDNCGIASTSIDITNFTCSNVGDNTITLTVTDIGGNISTTITTVTVEDTIAPSANCVAPFSVFLDANGQATITTADIDNGSTDNCGIANVSIDTTTFDHSNLGNNTVILTLTDINGNLSTCTTIVTVIDNIPPIPPSITHVSDYTCNGDTAMTGDNTLEISGIAEEDSMIEVFQDGTSIGTTITTNAGFFTFDHTGTVLADGTYNFTVTATDIAGNTSPISMALTITINSTDTDGDGLPDFCDDDDDGNGVDDEDEDCDGDGIIDSLDTDNSACASAITEIKSYGFSPNGDGVNDGWVIENITSYPNSLVQVYNRSGKLVFKKKGYQNDWDGISNQISNSGTNGRLPVGPYLFIIDLGDGSQPTRGWLYINY